MNWNNKRLQIIQSNLSTWVNSLLHLFQEFIKETTYPYRLVEIYYCQKLEKKIAKLQFSAKNIYFEITLQNLIINNELIQALSPSEVRVITYYACMENMQPHLAIESLSYSEINQEEIFNIKNRYKNSYESKSAIQISQEKALLEKFSSTDAHTIGFILGANSILKEKNFLENIKNSD